VRIEGVTVFASAKINIGLKVLPLREDGFHPIEGVFQTVNLHDMLTVTPMSGKGRCHAHCNDAMLPEKNTITAAYEAFIDEVGECASIGVVLKKNIPAGGGLGGGSSDAAALIRALELLNDIRLDDKQLCRIAGKVGSDVFFFLCCKTGTAIVTGRGECVQDIGRRSDLFFVLVFPHVSSSTKDAYALIDAADRLGRKYSDSTSAELEATYKSPVCFWSFTNDFTEVVSDKIPEVQSGLAALKQCGAHFSEMSGSGSTVYGVFTSRTDADTAVRTLKTQGYNCIAVQ